LLQKKLNKYFFISYQEGSASELKALLAARAVEKVLDPEALAYYFRADAIPTPKSVFQDVFKLPAGMSLSWSPGTTPAITPFWQVEDLRVDVPNTEAEVLRGLRDRIDLAVRERLVADVPLGLFLSGGIDSAVVAESASRQAGSLEAFTIGFDDPTHDESGIAAQTAKAFGLTHHVERLGAEEALGMLDEATELLDEPLADASILPTLLLARFTRRHVTVALSGDGGDELLLGYQHVPAHAMIEAYPFLRRPGELAARVLEKLPASDGYFSFGFKAQRLARGMGSADPWARDLAWRGSWSGPMASRLLRGADVSAPDRHLAALANDVPGDWGFWRQWTWMYLRSFLMDQVMVKVDRATMHFSLEGRAPLLDPRVVSYLFSLDDRWKLGRFAHKALFKRLLRERLPANVLALPKHGFAIPIAAWLKTALAEELQQSVAYARENLPHAVDADVVEAMRVEHAAGRIDRRKELWSWLQFIRWHRRWVA
jgi:asparagine synthase (glutamine-hydrolysing)